MKLTRRQMIGGLTTLLTSVSLNLQGAEKSLPYKQWYEKELKVSKDTLRHPALNKEYKPSPEEIRDFRERIAKQLPNRNPEDFKFERGTSFSPFIGTQKSWEEYCDRQFDIYTACFRFLGVEDKRTRALEVMEIDIPLRFPTHDKIPLYIAMAFFDDSRKASFNLTGMKEKMALEINPIIGSRNSFNYQYSFDGQRVRLVHIPNGPVLISNASSLSSYYSGASELVHLALAEGKRKYVEDKSNEAIKSVKWSKELSDTITQQANFLEEGIVHAGMQKFIEATGEKEGFTKEEINNLFSELQGKPLYKHMRRAYSLLGDDVKADFTRLRNNYDLLDRK